MSHSLLVLRASCTRRRPWPAHWSLRDRGWLPLEVVWGIGAGVGAARHTPVQPRSPRLLPLDPPFVGGGGGHPDDSSALRSLRQPTRLTPSAPAACQRELSEAPSAT